MRKLRRSLLKKLVRIIFIVNGFGNIFKHLSVHGHGNKPAVYIKHFTVKCNDKQYIIALGMNVLQRKKLKNAIAHEQVIGRAYRNFYKINKSVKSGRFLFIDYAIYNYFDDATMFSGDKDFEYALTAAQSVYEHAKYYEITDANVDDFIIQNIQIIIPHIKTAEIINQPTYRDCRAALLQVGRIKCAAQHGDYNLPNMLKHGKDYYLVDLERTMPNMIASYDWYHLLKGNKNCWSNPVSSPEMENVPNSHILKLFMDIFIGKGARHHDK